MIRDLPGMFCLGTQLRELGPVKCIIWKWYVDDNDVRWMYAFDRLSRDKERDRDLTLVTLYTWYPYVIKVAWIFHRWLILACRLACKSQIMRGFFGPRICYIAVVGVWRPWQIICVKNLEKQTCKLTRLPRSRLLTVRSISCSIGFWLERKEKIKGRLCQ